MDSLTNMSLTDLTLLYAMIGGFLKTVLSKGCFVSCSNGNPPGGGGYLDKILLGMCRWPLKAPNPLWSILCKP